jgi:Ca2+-binding RTX toxin-like protein
MRAKGDILTGGPGSDTFQFSGLDGVGKVITDFAAGTGGDVLDLHGLLVLTGYGGSNGLQDGVVRVVQNGANAEVQVDTHPGDHHWVTAVTLQSVASAALTLDNFIF